MVALTHCLHLLIFVAALRMRQLNRSHLAHGSRARSALPESYQTSTARVPGTSKMLNARERGSGVSSGYE